MVVEQQINVEERYLQSEIKGLNRQVQSLEDEILGRRLAGVDSPRLKEELYGTVEQRWSRQDELERLCFAPEDPEESKAWEFTREINRRLDDYKSTTGKEVRYVTDKIHRTYTPISDLEALSGSVQVIPQSFQKTTKRRFPKKAKAVKLETGEEMAAPIGMSPASAPIETRERIEEKVQENLPDIRQQTSESYIPPEDRLVTAAEARTTMGGTSVANKVVFEPVPEDVEPEEMIGQPTSPYEDSEQHAVIDQVAHPVREVIIPEEVEALLAPLSERRLAYLEAKRTVRSFWRNLAGNIRSRVGREENPPEAVEKPRSFWGRFTNNVRSRFSRGESPEEAMERTRLAYLNTRNDYLARSVLQEVNSRPVYFEVDENHLVAYRTDLATRAAELIGEENARLADEELALNQITGQERFYARYFRHPVARTATGLLLNLGIGAAVGTGAWPLAAPLIAARIGLGTIGFEGLFHKAQDVASGRWGARRQFTTEELPQVGIQESLHRSASFYEDRIRKAIPEMSDTEKRLLPQVYRTPIKEQIETALGIFAVDGVLREESATKISNILRGRRIINGEVVNGSGPTLLDLDLLQKEDAMVFARKTAAARWAGAAVLSTALTTLTVPGLTTLREYLFPSGELTPPGITPPETTPPPPSMEPPGVVPPIPPAGPPLPDCQDFGTDYYGFQDPDWYAEELFGTGDVSNVEGYVEGQFAQHIASQEYPNLKDFNYLDSQDVQDLNAYRIAHSESEIQIQAMEDYIVDHNPEEALESVYNPEEGDDEYWINHFTDETRTNLTEMNVPRDKTRFFQCALTVGKKLRLVA